MPTTKKKSVQKPKLKFKLRNQTWTVVVTDKTPPPYEKGTLMGHCDFSKRRISIAASLSTLDKRKTLLHELMHAAWPHNIISSARTEEKVVAAMEEPLYDLMLQIGLINDDFDFGGVELPTEIID